ncbi:MAG: tautomerase family protein [Actinomycetota bacterium]
MPVVTVQLWAGRTLDQKRALVAALTEAMVEHADADPSGLHVVLQEVPPENWARAGVLGVDRDKTQSTTRATIVGLSHLLLQVAELERAERFYVDGLGFRIRKRDTFSDGRALTVLAEGMGLTQGGAETRDTVEHIAFRVKNVPSYAARVEEAGGARVEEAGGTLVSGPAPGAYGTSLYFHDPDGNKIEFHGD